MRLLSSLLLLVVLVGCSIDQVDQAVNTPLTTQPGAPTVADVASAAAASTGTPWGAVAAGVVTLVAAGIAAQRRAKKPK